MAYFCLKLSDFDLAGGMRNRGLPKWADPQLRPKNHEEDAMANPRTPHAFASTRKAFKTASGKTGEFYSLPALAREFPNIKRLPHSIRIVLESVLRHCDGQKITREHVA